MTESKIIAEINNTKKEAMDTGKSIVVGTYYGLTHRVHSNGTETFKREK